MPPRPFDPADFETGLTLLVDKPLNWTSFDVVAKVRNTLRVKKIGHAGTLDPLATGLLVLCIGPHTKRIEEIQAQEKTYVAEITLGAITESYDSEFPPQPVADPSGLAEAQIREAMRAFVGPIQQTPPQYSAIKIEGKRAYNLARQGKAVQLEPRTVHIHAFDFIVHAPPDKVTVEIRCSKGTYIRSLAHDLGQALGVGGYLSALARTQIGPHKLADAWTVEGLVEYARSLRAQQMPSAS